jgi:hypothetical protein
MKSIGNNHSNFNVPPDTVNTILLAAATAQAMDYPTGTALVRLTGITTGGSQLNFYANAQSTAVVVPSSGSSATTSTTGNSVPVLGTRDFAVASSTSFGLIAPTSGYVHVECWKR